MPRERERERGKERGRERDKQNSRLIDSQCPGHSSAIVFQALKVTDSETRGGRERGRVN